MYTLLPLLSPTKNKAPTAAIFPAAKEEQQQEEFGRQTTTKEANALRFSFGWREKAWTGFSGRFDWATHHLFRILFGKSLTRTAQRH